MNLGFVDSESAVWPTFPRILHNLPERMRWGGRSIVYELPFWNVLLLAISVLGKRVLFQLSPNQQYPSFFLSLLDLFHGPRIILVV